MLTKTQCNQFKPKVKSYKKFDGNGLYLEISPKGNKNWRLKYYFQKKEKRISFGKYPIVTLIQARQKRDEAKKLLSEGIDPSSDRQQKQKEIKLKLNSSFKQIALEWYEKQQERWSESRQKYILHTLEKNVFPFIGKTLISDIETSQLFEVLQKIEDRGSYYVTNRTNQVCKQVFRYGIRTGKCSQNPADQLVGAFKVRKVQHFAALESKEIPELLKAIRNNDARLYARTRNAIKFSLLTFCRPGEVRRARWQDIDLNTCIWTIPKEFMKTGKVHIVPLARQSIYILENQRQEIDHINSDWVFPSITKLNQPISDGTVNVALKKLGFNKRMTAHGFRALARTTIREKLKYYPDIIEAQLAHKPIGPLGSAYDRAQFIDDRIIMMQMWADYIDSLGEL